MRYLYAYNSGTNVFRTNMSLVEAIRLFFEREYMAISQFYSIDLQLSPNLSLQVTCDHFTTRNWFFFFVCICECSVIFAFLCELTTALSRTPSLRQQKSQISFWNKQHLREGLLWLARLHRVLGFHSQQKHIFTEKSRFHASCETINLRNVLTRFLWHLQENLEPISKQIKQNSARRNRVLKPGKGHERLTFSSTRFKPDFSSENSSLSSTEQFDSIGTPFSWTELSTKMSKDPLSTCLQVSKNPNTVKPTM